MFNKIVNFFIAQTDLEVGDFVLTPGRHAAEIVTVKRSDRTWQPECIVRYLVTGATTTYPAESLTKASWEQVRMVACGVRAE